MKRDKKRPFDQSTGMPMLFVLYAEPYTLKLRPGLSSLSLSSILRRGMLRLV